MNLNIVLYDSTKKEEFVSLIQNCLYRGYDLQENGIKTWVDEVFINRDRKTEHGFKHSGTQFENNGWVTLCPDILGVKAVFLKSSKVETSREQEALILLRFATMLRNHFTAKIRAITLFGL